MLPVRVMHHFGSQFFGFGPNSQEIQAMTSVHKKGKEPCNTIRMFNHTWEVQSGSFIWDGLAYLTWKLVD